MDYLVSSATMIALDSLYLTAAKPTWASMVQKIQGSPMKVRVFPAIGVYLLMTFALYFFILSQHRSVYDAALLGLVIYGVFDLTNKALFTEYRWILAIVDMLWGAALFAASAWTASFVTK